MGDQFDFSLLIGSQYDGGPMEWDEQTLYVSTGTILNHVDINKVSTTHVMTARPKVRGQSCNNKRKSAFLLFLYAKILR